MAATGANKQQAWKPTAVQVLVAISVFACSLSVRRDSDSEDEFDSAGGVDASHSSAIGAVISVGDLTSRIKAARSNGTELKLDRSLFSKKGNGGETSYQDSEQQDQDAGEQGGDSAQKDQGSLQQGGDSAQKDQGPVQQGGDSAQKEQAPVQQGGDSAQKEQAPVQQGGDSAQQDQDAVQQGGDSAQQDEDAGQQGGGGQPGGDGKNQTKKTCCDKCAKFCSPMSGQCHNAKNHDYYLTCGGN
eukprot:TRINITY_DN6573_c0_g1_i3.p1 TRINITY_DN6573_c0_g1~~TRINITY_DN6573_c0_g1_i3.p1  ORF type:complete len:243 (+),score=38.34 TRINITY_DN6573_c0_g1_i3:93-821(+)